MRRTTRESYADVRDPTGATGYPINTEGQDPQVAHHFPEKVFPAELREIDARRAGLPNCRSGLLDHVLRQREGTPVFPSTELGLVGLALSGGGIRSATFNLGVLQAMMQEQQDVPGAMAESDDWRPVACIFSYMDYLSTVSGGTYIGSCLSALLEGQTHRDWPLQQRVPEDSAVRHLRLHSRPHSIGAILFAWFCGQLMIVLTVFPLSMLMIKILLLFVWFKHAVVRHALDKDCYTASLMDGDGCDWMFARVYIGTTVLLMLMAATVLLVGISAKLRRWCKERRERRHTSMLQPQEGTCTVWKTFGILCMLACWVESVDTWQYLCMQYEQYAGLFSACAIPLVIASSVAAIALANRTNSWLALISSVSAGLAVVTIFFLFQVSSYVLEKYLFGRTIQFKDITDQHDVLKLGGGVLAWYIFMELCLNVNEMSLNGIYRRKLRKVYLIQQGGVDTPFMTDKTSCFKLCGDPEESVPLAPTIEPAALEDSSDGKYFSALEDSTKYFSDPLPAQIEGQPDFRLSELNTRQKHAPFFIINAAVDLQTTLGSEVGLDSDLIDRTADFFTFTKLFVGRLLPERMTAAKSPSTVLKQLLKAHAGSSTAFDSAETASGSAETAFDSTGTAFDSANTALNSLHNLTTARDSAESAFDSAEAACSNAESAFNSAETAFDSTNTACDSANSAFDSAKSAFDSAEAAFDSAKSAFDSAKSAFDSAKSAFDSAEAAFDSTNTACDSANSAFDSAKSAFDSAKTACDSAKSAFDSAESARDIAETAFDSTKTACDSAKSAFDSAEAACDSAETPFDSAEAAFDSAGTAYTTS